VAEAGVRPEEGFLMRNFGLLLVVALGIGSAGCGAGLSQRPVESDAALGRVILYRSGVAYFERHAHVKNGKLVLYVPAERVDDFLKSLTIRDRKTGRSVPVSFPTQVNQGDVVQLTIELPEDGPKDLAISYVTESPAWKPSYRVELGKAGKGRLEAWAVVDNISGEDWNQVMIGVGSTSALSFKYDLHSVRLVEREVVNDAPRLALAPPTGGSPYSVPKGEVSVLGNFGAEDVDGLADRRTSANMDKEMAHADEGKPVAGMKSGGKTRDPVATETSGQRPQQKPNRNSRGDDVVKLAESLKKNKQHVRIEGYARRGEADAKTASMARANAMRQALLENGVPAEQVEAVGTGSISEKDGVRVLAQNEAQAGQARQPDSQAASNDPLGSALFLSKTPMSIKKERSAMLSMVSASTRAEQVYFYDPISNRGSRRFAFRAVKLDNPSDHTLDPGPFTVYAAGEFLGEGLSEAIPPKSTAFIPFALDRQLLVEPVSDTREEIDRLVTIQRGIATTEAQTIRRTTLALSNRGDKEARVYVRHLVPDGWTLRQGKARFEKLRGAYLFPVMVPARGALKLEIEETQPLEKSVDINTAAGVETIALFLKKAKKLEPALAKQLDEIVKIHKDMVDVGEHIQTIESQMSTYRERIDEIHAQLVTLRRVTTADKLSRHLAQKMEEISDRLQKSTLQVTDLKGKQMTQRVTLQDRLAELTLKRDKDDKAFAEK
jgi:hypothetical protein